MGARLFEETGLKPKPMVEIGDKPILWPIMKLYFYYGYNDSIIYYGYKQHIIKEKFADYYHYNSDVAFDFTGENNSGVSMKIHKSKLEPWKVTCLDTGLNTMTGGRIKRIKKYIGDEAFMMTYGDGV